MASRCARKLRQLRALRPEPETQLTFKMMLDLGKAMNHKSPVPEGRASNLREPQGVSVLRTTLWPMSAISARGSEASDPRS